MTTLFAFLHHLAAFTLFAALVLEFVLARSELNFDNARRLLLADRVYGLSAGLILIIGLLRVFLFEKGATFYFHSAPFIAKLALFLIVGLLSIYPTMVFLAWRTALKNREAPKVEANTATRIRRIIHLELVGVVLIILCAAMAARGTGQVGLG